MRSGLIIFEDDHLLAINKPAGLNTHSPSPYAGEGIYEWLKNREPRWADLAIIHRLDKETSGILIFGKTSIGNKSLTEQFSRRAVHKKYILLTDRKVPSRTLVVSAPITRAGEKYVVQSHGAGEPAETRFHISGQFDRDLAGRGVDSSLISLEAVPVTGRTHQIRVHAAANGFPILGDTLYGGTAAERVFLHAEEITFVHPGSNEAIKLTAPPDFAADPRLALRTAMVDETQTDAFRLVHGASDGWPGLFVDRVGEFLLAQSEQNLSPAQIERLETLRQNSQCRGVYFKRLSRHIRGASPGETSPQLLMGDRAPDEFIVRENGVSYSLSFSEGYSVGLFFDQRDNRRRLLTNYIAPKFSITNEPRDSATGPLEGLTVLNTFAYTCGFSVCAAKAGARVTSLDLSKKYLEWGKKNFALNSLDAARHDFIFGDTFDWLRRFAKKGRMFDIVILDPPTFSQSREQGVFRAEKDYGKLVAAALGVLRPGGVLLCSTNAAGLKPERFLEMVADAAYGSRRKITQQQYIPQPPDFPVSREEPAYLKTVWLRVT